MKNSLLVIKKTVQDLLSQLALAWDERSREVLIERFGLNDLGKRRTLPGLGKIYGVRGERIRQIEERALNIISDFSPLPESQAILMNIAEDIMSAGGIVARDSFTARFSQKKQNQNFVHCFLSFCSNLAFFRQNKEIHACWTIKPDRARRVLSSLKELHTHIKEKNKAMSETEILNIFSDILARRSITGFSDKILLAWLSFSRVLEKSKLGDWGTKEMISHHSYYAYKILEENGQPMHYLVIAKEASRRLGVKTSPRGYHQSLVRDKRFMVVGEGMYKIKTDEDKPGFAQDVILDILKGGPLSVSEIVKRVLGVRCVKAGSVKKYIAKLCREKKIIRASIGRYRLADAVDANKKDVFLRQKLENCWDKLKKGNYKLVDVSEKVIIYLGSQKVEIDLNSLPCLSKEEFLSFSR